MTRSIIFSMVEIRPDIAFIISLVSWFAKSPSHQHTETVKTIFKYLKNLKHWGKTYREDEKLKIEGYLNSDWASDKESQMSISGFIFILSGGPMSWCSKRLSTIALFFKKAEYPTPTLAAKKATWLCLLLTKLKVLEMYQQHAKIKVSNKNSFMQAINNDFDSLKASNGDFTVSTKGNSQKSLALVYNLIFYAKTKHINI